MCTHSGTVASVCHSSKDSISSDTPSTIGHFVERGFLTCSKSTTLIIILLKTKIVVTSIQSVVFSSHLCILIPRRLLNHQFNHFSTSQYFKIFTSIMRLNSPFGFQIRQIETDNNATNKIREKLKRAQEVK